MSKTTIRHGAVVQCDVPGCQERYTTYSLASLAREQAANAGWERVKIGTIPGSPKWGLGGPACKADICPTHKLKPRMSGAEATP